MNQQAFLECHDKEQLLQKFLRYAQIDTQANPCNPHSPSSEGQRILAQLLAEECEEMGLCDVQVTSHGLVMATLAGIPAGKVPTIAWLAHLDTSPECSGHSVKPRVIRNYNGESLSYPGNPHLQLIPAECPDLAQVVGHTIVTTDGRTLLGGDDKAGVAVIMQAAQRLQRSDQCRAEIKILFTCDEEIGRGTDHIDITKLAARCAYTLDGGGVGQIDCETFSADSVELIVEGINTHPSEARGKMVNALRLLVKWLDRLPQFTLSPESTAGRDGFIHPYWIEGGVASAKAKLLLRDFETEQLDAQAKILEQITALLQAEFPRATFRMVRRPQYRNMRERLLRDPQVVIKAEHAMRSVGLEPRRCIIRGGTDGALLTAKGLPCPNLSCGQHNPHSPLEWVSVEEMWTAVLVLEALAHEWGRP